MPEVDDVTFFYNHDYHRHNIDREYSEHHVPAISAVHELLKGYLKQDKLRIHDEGCGYGHLVWHLNKMGAVATGTDLSTASIAAGRARGNLAIFCDSAGNFLKDERVNALIMIHCLEHQYFPLETMRIVRNVLDDRGVGFILVPNVNYLPIIKGGMQKDPGFLYPAHLHYFTVDSLRSLMNFVGLSILDLSCTPTLDFAPGMADEMLFQATGFHISQLKEPDLLINALLKNDLGYELRAIVARNDSPFLKILQR